jgi:hypothetical protein
MGHKVRGKNKKLSHTGHRQKKAAHAERTNKTGKKWVNKHAVGDRVDPIAENGDRRQKKAEQALKEHEAQMQAFIEAGDIIAGEDNLKK